MRRSHGRRHAACAGVATVLALTGVFWQDVTASAQSVSGGQVGGGLPPWVGAVGLIVIGLVALIARQRGAFGSIE